MLRSLPLIAAACAASLFITTEAAAQNGRGRPKGPKAPTQTSTSTPTSTSPSASTSTTSAATAGVDVAAGPVTPAVTTFRQFGSWLDDASAPTPGEGRTGIGVGYWRLSGGSQINAPMVDAGYGLTDRVQVSASVPFYHMNYAGTTYRGVDDIYISAKYTVFDPTLTESEVGLAVSPVVEVLSAGGIDEGRVHYGFPVSLELRRQPWRVYGSAGYFSRGSVFTGGAIEWATPLGLVVTSALIQSYSLKQDEVLDSMGISRQRADFMAGVGYPLGHIASAYASFGRSLTSIDEGGTSFSFSGGLSFRFSAAKATP